MVFVFRHVCHALQERKYRILFEAVDHNLYYLALHVVVFGILNLFDQNLDPPDHHASYLLLALAPRDHLVRDFLWHAFHGLSVRHLHGVDVPHLQLARLGSSCMLVSEFQTPNQFYLFLYEFQLFCFKKFLGNALRAGLRTQTKFP